MINARPCSQHEKVPIVDVMLRASVSLWQAGISRTSNSMGNERSEATFRHASAIIHHQRYMNPISNTSLISCQAM